MSTPDFARFQERFETARAADATRLARLGLLVARLELGVPPEKWTPVCVFMRRV